LTREAGKPQVAPARLQQLLDELQHILLPER